RQPMAGDRRTRRLCADRAPVTATQERTIPRDGGDGVMHAVNRRDAHALIEVMSNRRGCD
ncbi:hypothetical protein NO135_25890, partial [Clostridioides difficile]|nr:hypothetical protein [Clostridioides difficile]